MEARYRTPRTPRQPRANKKRSRYCDKERLTGGSEPASPDSSEIRSSSSSSSSSLTTKTCQAASSAWLPSSARSASAETPAAGVLGASRRSCLIVDSGVVLALIRRLILEAIFMVLIGNSNSEIVQMPTPNSRFRGQNSSSAVACDFSISNYEKHE